MPPFFRVLRPLLIASMFACIALSVATFLQTFAPTWSATYLVACVFFISLEAFFSARMVKQYRISGNEWWSFRIAEWVVILFVVKLLSYAAPGWHALIDDMAKWQADPTAILSLEYIITLVLVGFTWIGSTDIAGWLANLDQEPVGPDFSPMVSLGSLQSLFFTGGVIIVTMAGLTQVSLQSILQMDRPPVGGIIANVLVYFVVGLLLLSQARLELLASRWQASGVDVAPGIQSRWAQLALATLAAIALVALLLPTRYSLGILDIAGVAIAIVGNILLIIGYLLNLLLFWLLSLLVALMGLFGQAPLPSPAAAPALPMFAPVTPRGPTPDWVALVRSILFWASLYVIIGYAVWQFVRSRRGWWEALARLPVIGWLMANLAALFAGLRAATTQASAVVRRRLARPPAPVLPPRRWLRLGGLSPRELLMYFYLSTVQRAGQAGLPRAPSQTAREYAATLREKLPEGGEDVGTLSDAFEVARYSGRPVAKDDTATPRRSWERLKRVLRERRTGSGE